jgi:hypothetical protein
MKLRKFLSLYGLVVGVLLAGTEVRAHNPPGVPIAAPGPLVCQTQFFKIQAKLGPSGEFPIPVACVNHSGETCSDYGYSVSTLSPTGPNIDNTIVAVSADQDLDGTTPASNVFAPGEGDSQSNFLKLAKHEYSVRFRPASPTKTAEVHIFIAGSSRPRLSTVLVSAGTKSTDSCVIAGPGVGGGAVNPNAVVATSTTFSSPANNCPVILVRDAAGNITEVLPAPGSDPACTTEVIAINEIILNGQPLHFAGDGITTGGVTILGNTHRCTTYILSSGTAIRRGTHC